MTKEPIDAPQEDEEEVPDFGDWFPLAERKEFVGVYTGSHETTLGIAHDFVDTNGERFSLPGWAMLTRKLNGLGGHRVRIAYRGELEPNKKGRKGAMDVAVFDRGIA